jgi:hypothetical protein
VVPKQVLKTRSRGMKREAAQGAGQAPDRKLDKAAALI